MTQIKTKRVYEASSPDDGYRVLVDRLWPRGMKKENLKDDEWEKGIAPSTDLREWYHADEANRWNEFEALYIKELEHSPEMKDFIERIKQYPVVTLLFAAKDTVHNQAVILQKYMEENI